MEVITDALNNIGFDWRVALANLVNFLIIFFLLKRFAWKPLQETLRKRREKIEKGVEDARRAETKLMEAESRKEDIVSEARREANDIVSQARDEEREIVAGAKDKAQEEANKVTSQAREQIQAEEEAMKRKIKEESAEMIVTGVEKLLRRKIDRDSNKQFIKTTLRSSQSKS